MEESAKRSDRNSGCSRESILNLDGDLEGLPKSGI